MTSVKRPEFVRRIIDRHRPSSPNSGVSIDIKTDEIRMKVCIGPPLSRSAKEKMGIGNLRNARSIHIEGTLKDGRQFVVFDPLGLGRLSKEGFCGLDVDPTGMSMREYIGMGPEDFYAFIQDQIVKEVS